MGKMLCITMRTSAESAKKYYCEEYYKDGQSTALDYYSEKEQAIGRWGGSAAQALGLTGDISPKDFAALCDNINPLTGKTLTGRNDKDRTVGYDLTFNCNKSVSLAHAFGSEEEKRIILAAFHDSVRETMIEVEAGMQTRVRVKGQNENRMSGNIAYGEFTHFTARPVDGIADPALHSHCFVFNATQDKKENKWKAGQFQQLKQDAPYYEAVFQSKFARKLQDEGYRIRHSKNGFELQGVEQSTIAKFSRRTKEIEAYIEEHHITSEREKARVSVKTRESKHTNVTAEQQERAWHDRMTADELAGMRFLRQLTPGTIITVNEENAAQAALQFSLDHHLERKSVASDKEILATAIKSSIGKATPEQVSQAFKEDKNILATEDKLRTFITTKQALKEERELILRAAKSKNKFRPIDATYEPENALLNDEQRAAVKHTLSSSDGIIIIAGHAGTGKTTLMKAVKQGIENCGKHIFSFAPSSEASRGVQRSEGFENADTVAMLILDTQRHAAFKNQVLWIDEAGMLSNKDMSAVLAIAEAQSARVILSGDTRQHTSVQRGDALRILNQEAGINSITVSKIQRQKNADYKEAVNLLSHGAAEKGFKKLEQMGAIHEIADSGERCEAIAEDYYRTSYNSASKTPIKEVQVISPTHAEGEAVTRQIRQKLKEHEVIGEQDHSFTVLKNRQLTEAEKQQPESYEPGNILAFFQNAKGIKAGSRLEVNGVQESHLSAHDANGLSYTVPYTEGRKYSVFEPREIQVAEGDKIRITGNGKSLENKSLFNGSTFSVEGFDTSGNIKLSNDSVIDKDFGHFNLGYVATSHSSQGKTADKVIISQSSATSRASSMEQFYVSVSRGREAVSIYTDDKDELQQAVAESSQRKSATELMAKRDEKAREMNLDASRMQPREPSHEHYYPHTIQTQDHGLQNETRTR